MMENVFPTVKKEIANLIEDQEGNISRAKVLSVGSLIVMLGMILSFDAYAKHRSHSSHSSHSSTSYHKSHISHTSARDHSSHSSHSSSSHNSHSSSSHTSHASSSHTNSPHSNAAETTTINHQYPDFAETTSSAIKEIPQLLGDVNGDGVINSADARLALRAAVRLENFPPESKAFTAADVDFDQTITSADARLILRAAVNLEELNG